jgi:hypothetical protein
MYGTIFNVGNVTLCFGSNAMKFRVCHHTTIIKTNEAMTKHIVKLILGYNDLSMDSKGNVHKNWSYIRIPTAVRRQYSGSTAAVQRQYGGSTAAVQRQYGGSTAAVLPSEF